MDVLIPFIGLFSILLPAYCIHLLVSVTRPNETKPNVRKGDHR